MNTATSKRDPAHDLDLDFAGADQTHSDLDLRSSKATSKARGSIHDTPAIEYVFPGAAADAARATAMAIALLVIGLIVVASVVLVRLGAE